MLSVCSEAGTDSVCVAGHDRASSYGWLVDISCWCSVMFSATDRCWLDRCWRATLGTARATRADCCSMNRPPSLFCQSSVVNALTRFLRMIGVDITADYSAFGPKMVPVESVNAGAPSCLGLRWSKYSTHSTVCTSGLSPCSSCVCALFEGLTEFCCVFRFVFVPVMLNFTSGIEQLHFCCYCIDV